MIRLAAFFFALFLACSCASNKKAVSHIKLDNIEAVSLALDKVAASASESKIVLKGVSVASVADSSGFVKSVASVQSVEISESCTSDSASSILASRVNHSSEAADYVKQHSRPEIHKLFWIALLVLGAACVFKILSRR